MIESNGAFHTMCRDLDADLSDKKSYTALSEEMCLA